MNQANTRYRMAILEMCEREVGTLEEPPNSNKIKYNDWYYPKGHPYFTNPKPWHYCGTAVSYIYYFAAQHVNRLHGSPLVETLRGNGMSQLGYHYIPTFDNYARNQGWNVSKEMVQPGDIVNFEWNGQKDGRGMEDHTGIFEKWDRAPGWFYCYEGNTTPEGVEGNQSNGGGFYRRRRHVSTVATFINVIDAA